MTAERQLEELCSLICEERATQADVDALAALLRDDEASQARYLALVDLHHSLRWTYRGEQLAGAVTTLRDAGVGPDGRRPQKRNSISVVRVAVIAVAAAAAIVLAWFGTTREVAPAVAPPEVAARGPVVEMLPQAIVGRVVESDGALWLGDRERGPELTEGELQVHEGRLVVALASGGRLVLRGPAAVVLGEGQLELISGQAVVSVGKGESVTVRQGGGVAKLRNCDLGLFAAAGKGTWCALRGDAEVVFDASATGRLEKVKLSRDDSVTAIVGGGLLANVVGDGSGFRELLLGGAGVVQLANAGFEYPATDGDEALAAVGWRFQVLPLMNATEMPRDDAVGLLAPGDRTAMPQPPEGRQWAYLAAERLPDGRHFHSATFQELGPFKRGVTYELRATIAATGTKGEPLPFAVGLYGGDPESQPRVALSAATGELLRGETRTVEVRFRSPNTNVYFDQHLFVRAELGPPSKAEKTKLLIDKIEVKIVDGDE